MPKFQDLPGLGVGLGHDAGGIGAQGRIGERVFGELDAALRLQQPSPLLLDVNRPRVGRLVARPALLLQRRHPVEIDLALLQCDPCCRAGRLGCFQLQPQIGVVERAHHLACLYLSADLGGAGEKLAADPEAEIGLDAGADRPGEPCAGAWLSSRTVVTMTTCGADGGAAVSVWAAITANRERSSGVVAAATAATPIPATASASLLRRRICQPPGSTDYQIIGRF